MFKKILVPTDGSTQAAQAAIVAAKMAKNTDSQVLGLYITSPFPYVGMGDISPAGLHTYQSQAKAEAQQALDILEQACAAQGVSFASDTIEHNSAYEAILQTAEVEGCDLIVMGSHGRHGIKALILGSVTQKVLTHATVPVLVVKS